MEKALYISEAEDIKFWNKKYTRVYFGNEFCERLIPSIEALNRVLDFTLEKKIDFSLAIGLVAEENINYVEELLKALSIVRPHSEVIMNDWGILKMGQKYKLKIALGRLLTKQQRDPRISVLIQDFPNDLANNYKKGCLNKYFIKFLNENHIDRIELDNLLQGLSLDELDNNRISCSLYFPYGYIATSRFCLLASSNGVENRLFINKDFCDKECKKYNFILRDQSMPVPLFLNGNAIFFKNRNLKVISNNKINRLVFEPKVPI